MSSAELNAAQKALTVALEQLQSLFEALEDGGLDPVYYLNECARLNHALDDAQRRVQAASAAEERA